MRIPGWAVAAVLATIQCVAPAQLLAAGGGGTSDREQALERGAVQLPPMDLRAISYGGARQFDPVRDLALDLTGVTASAQELFEQAQSLFFAGKHFDAIATYRLAYALGQRTGRPPNALDWHKLAVCFNETMFHDDAMYCAERAFSMQPDLERALLLAQTYANGGECKKGRDLLERYCQAHPESEDSPEVAYFREHFWYATYHVQFRMPPGDWKFSIRDRDGLPVYLPLETDYQQARLLGLENTRSWRLMEDGAGNRKIVLMPDDGREPVVVSIELRISPVDYDLSSVDAVPYTYPSEYEAYRHVSRYLVHDPEGTRWIAFVDPTTHLAQAWAKRLRGKTRRETIENVLRWCAFRQVTAQGAECSEEELAGGDGACRGMSQGMCAILRAQGFAARCCGGRSCWGAVEDDGPFYPGHGPVGHAWVEVWEPAFSRWVPLHPNHRAGAFIAAASNWTREALDARLQDDLRPDGAGWQPPVVDYAHIANEAGSSLARLHRIKLVDRSLQEPRPQTAVAANLPPQGATHLSASYYFGGNSVAWINVGNSPTGSHDHGDFYYSWEGHLGSEEWVQIDSTPKRTVSGVSVYWFDDTASGGDHRCRIPASWEVLWKDGDALRPVEHPSRYGTARDGYNHVTFRPVETTCIRVKIRSQPGFAGGILDLQVR